MEGRGRRVLETFGGFWWSFSSLLPYVPGKKDWVLDSPGGLVWKIWVQLLRCSKMKGFAGINLLFDGKKSEPSTALPPASPGRPALRSGRVVSPRPAVMPAMIGVIGCARNWCFVWFLMLVWWKIWKVDIKGMREGFEFIFFDIIGWHSIIRLYRQRFAKPKPTRGRCPSPGLPSQRWAQNIRRLCSLAPVSDAVICRSVCSFFGASLWTWVEHGFVRDTRDLDCYLCGTIFVVIHWQAFCALCDADTEALFEQLGGDRQRDGPHGWTGPGSQGSLLSTGHVAGLKTALGWNWNSTVKFLEHGGVLLGIHPDLLICVLEVGGIDMNWQKIIRLAWNPLTERKFYGMKPCDRPNALHPPCAFRAACWVVAPASLVEQPWGCEA